MFNENTPFTMPVAPASGYGSNDGFDGGALWLVIFVLFFAFGGWGNGGFGGNNAVQGALTRGDLCQDMNFQELSDSVRGVQNGLCDGFYAQNTTMLNGFNGVQRDMCTGFANVANGITTLGYQMKDCCCETNRNLDSVRYENAKNTCDIINAGNANTQRIIDTITQNEIQTLRDNLQTANFQLSQQAQNTTLINALSPTPRPAYITCSPYQSQVLAMNAFGNGCSCA